MDRIRLLDLTFFAIVGELPHERQAPQPIAIDLEVDVDLRRAGMTDRLSEGVDYRALYSAVAGAVSDDPEAAPHLVEGLAERVVERVLAVDGVLRAVVRVRKPWAGLAGPGRVEVEITRP